VRSWPVLPQGFRAFIQQRNTAFAAHKAAFTWLATKNKRLAKKFARLFINCGMNSALATDRLSVFRGCL
jgi:hypothetical protein